MEIQKKVSVQGEFAKKGTDIKDGDLVTIKSEGTTISGEFGDRLAFTIATRNGDKVLTFNQTTLNNLVDAYGKESKAWVGKEAKVWIIKMSVSGKIRDVVFLAEPTWEINDEGFFYNPVEQRPVSDKAKADTEIAAEDLPF